MNKLILISIMCMFILTLVSATAPTNPTTISPADNSILLNQPVLSCSGSVLDAGEIAYTSFYNRSNSVLLNETLGTSFNTSNVLLNGNYFNWSCQVCNNSVYTREIYSLIPTATKGNNSFYYSFNSVQRDVNKVFDQSINSNNGTIGGGSFVMGIVQDGWKVNSIAQSINTSNDINLVASTGHTYNFWIKKEQNPTDSMTIAGLGLDGTGLIAVNLRTYLNLLDTGNITVVSQPYLGASVTTNSPILNNNTWYMVSLVWNGTSNPNTLLYINGQLNNSVNLVGVVTNPTAKINMGNKDVDRRGNITFDEFGFWNRTLTNTELTQIYNITNNFLNTLSCSGLTNRSLTYINFSSCSQGDASGTFALNFSHFNEEDMTKLNASNGIDLNAESPQDSKDFNFAYTNNHAYALCLAPSNINVNITGLSNYIPTNTSFTFARQYYFTDATIYGGLNSPIKLYSLKDSLASAVTFTATRQGSGVEDVYIWVQRFDAGTGTYTLVAIGKTGSNGQDIIYLRLTDAFYRILGIENGVVVHDSGTIHVTSTSYPMSLSGSGSEGVISDYGGIYNNLGNLNWNLTFNATGTNTIALTVVDSSGVSTSSCLRVTKITNQNGTQQIFYNCTSGALVTQSFQLTDLTKNYFAEFIAFNNKVYRVLDTLIVVLAQNLAQGLGKDGLFYAFFLTSALALLGSFNSKVMVFLALLGVGMSFALQLIDITWASVIVLLILGGLIIYKLK